jgi:hypothetical protein
MKFFGIFGLTEADTFTRLSHLELRLKNGQKNKQAHGLARKSLEICSCLLFLSQGIHPIRQWFEKRIL